ncbi:MAG: Arm DNA-binding domain-containing protein [Rhizomicrobium sp.]
MGKLTVLKIQQLTKPGQYGDGNCLYLQVKRDDQGRLSRSWVYRFRLNGKRREMGLGPLHLVGLAEARQKILECRKMHLDGIDPIEVRRAKREQAALERANEMTFKVCAEKYIASHKAGWKNDKHAAQWPSSLKSYAYPVIGALPAHRIDTALVMRVLEPIWACKPETASRLRGRIEIVLDWAKVHIAKLEKRTDMYVSTLRRFVEAVGGKLEIVARFPHHKVRISNFEHIDDDETA